MALRLSQAASNGWIISYQLLFVLSWILINFTSVNSQEELPTLLDPFPTDVEPEPEPTPYTECPADCAAGYEASLQKITELEGKLAEVNNTAGSKLDGLGGGGSGDTGSGSPPPSAETLTNTEINLQGNMTMVSGQLTADCEAASKAVIEEEIAGLRTEINSLIETLQTPAAGGGGGEGTGEGALSDVELYNNLTTVLDTLESTKLQTLTGAHNVWRKNFETVNKILSKMKKSNYSNNVIVVG